MDYINERRQSDLLSCCLCGLLHVAPRNEGLGIGLVKVEYAVPHVSYALG